MPAVEMIIRLDIDRTETFFKKSVSQTGANQFAVRW